MKLYPFPRVWIGREQSDEEEVNLESLCRSPRAYVEFVPLLVLYIELLHDTLHDADLVVCLQRLDF